MAVTSRAGVRALPLALRAVPAAWRERRAPQGPALLGLGLLSALLVLLFLRVSEEWWTAELQVLPLLGGALVLDTRRLRLLIGVVVVSLAVEVASVGLDETRQGGLVVIAVTAFACHELARSREETGLGVFGGETVLLDLRERLEQQGRLPALPPGWSADSVVRSAGEAAFAGDFVVSCRTEDRVEVALVDVSGKGVEAGTRSLLLSGALGGLLGPGCPATFLGRANDYLVRQDWEDGFATAVHVSVDLRTGAYAVASAGHLPLAQFDAGTGRWSLVEAPGVALGVLPGTTYDAVSGQLDRGDALLLYTDGLVEVPGRDLSYGIDKLLGMAERTVADGFRGGADALVRLVDASSGDDRGLVMLWRAH